MIGAIIGDVIGSVHERAATKSTDFPLFVERSRFTDDTVMTIATAQAILDGIPYREAYLTWGRRYRRAGYGGSFRRWLDAEFPEPYGSWGNGSAMRVSPVAFAFDTVDDVLSEAARTAEPTHGHPEGVKGAQAAALATFLARVGTAKPDIRREIGVRFGYDLTRSVAEIRPDYRFDVSCAGSVPEALVCFLETDSMEAAIRTAISLGGDADTQAAIAAAAAAAFDGAVTSAIRQETLRRLPGDMQDIVGQFEARFPLGRG